jgi:hypothetical protein
MPRKEFESFTRLDASDVNTYLMDQSVMTFGGTAARGSAIPTPVEGMVTYLEDSNTFEYWDSDSWDTLAPPSPSGNAIINGAFEINQRNFSSSTASVVGFDRWSYLKEGDGTSTYSSQAFTPGSGPTGYESANFLRLVTTGQTSSTAVSRITQEVEDVRSFAGQTVTLSFFAKAASGSPKIAVEVVQRFGSGGSPSLQVLEFVGQVPLETSWTRHSLTFTVPSISGKTIGTDPNSSSLSLRLYVSAGSDFNARTGSLGIQSNTFDIWGVQLEAGPTANVFRRNANSLAGELAACQRYYFRNTATSLFSVFGQGRAQSTTSSRQLVTLPVTMRIQPTSVDFSSLRLTDGAAANATVTSLTIQTDTSHTQTMSVTANAASGLTANQNFYLYADNSTSAFIGFSAEL